MGFLQVNSNNKDLSFIIGKNPASGLQLKKNKKGVFLNWYHNDSYNIYFKDRSNEMSYPVHPDAQFEYSNTAKFNNPRIYCDMFSDLLNDARIKPREHDVEGFHYEIFINLIYTHFKTIDIFKRYFTPLGINFEHETIVEGTNNYRVKISTDTQKMSYLLSVTNLFTMVASLNSDDYIYLTDDFVEKYIDMANSVDAPYFIKYLIKVRMLRSPKRFEKLLDKLNASSSHTFEFLFGDTHDARIEFVKNNIFGTKTIVDIGSGIDYRYLKFLGYLTQENKKNYYAIDIDEDAQFKAKRYVQNNNIEGVSVYADIDAVISNYQFENTYEKVDVLCTEVLEHNEIKEAQELIKKVLSNFNINKFLITVPNSEFNKHYSDNLFRHDDHKWEVPFDEFKKIIINCIDLEKYEIEFFPVGDKVDGIATSSGCIIKSKN